MPLLIAALVAAAAALSVPGALRSQRPLPAAPAAGTSSGRVLLVGTWHGRKGKYGSIQAALEDAEAGDWILVAPGDYRERPRARDGVRITTPNLHLRGMSRSGVVVDGTRLGAPRACDARARWQNLGPGQRGRNGIVVSKAA